MSKSRRNKRNYKISRDYRLKIVSENARISGKTLGIPIRYTDAERRKEESYAGALAEKLTDELDEKVIFDIIIEYLTFLSKKAPYVFSGSLISTMSAKFILPYRGRLELEKTKREQEYKDLERKMAVSSLIKER